MSAKKHETTAVAVQDTASLATQEIQNKALALAKGPDEFGLSATDIRIATLCLMQPASGMVSDQKAKLGDLINNEGEKVVAGLDKPIEVIALYKFETIRSYQASDGKFVKEEAYTGKKVERDGLEDNIPVRRYHTINFFVLPVEDIKNGEAFPVLIRFKSSSYQAGNKFASFLFKKRHFGKLPYEQTGVFSIERRQNEKKQNWAAFAFAEGRKTTEAEQKNAIEMVALINARKYTILEAEDQDAEVVSGDAGSHAKPVVVEGDVLNY